MAKGLFFETSREGARAVTQAFDFAMPAQAGLWNMREVVARAVAASPSIGEPDLYAQHFAPSGVRYTNIRRWAGRPWADQEQQLARMLLINFCSIYEAWLSATLAQIGAPSSLAKALQFPTSGTSGVGPHLASLAASSTMDRCFSRQLCRHKKWSHQFLESLLLCYRVFKEARNAIAHEGAIAGPKLVDAFARFRAVSPTDLGPIATIDVPVPALGQPLELPLRGILGFSDVILRLVVTLDERLAVTEFGERDLKRRWKEVHGTEVKIHGFVATRHSRLAMMIQKLDMPTPDDLRHLGSALKGWKLLWYP